MTEQEMKGVVEQCKRALLKQLHYVIYLNGYPTEAVPKATILSLDKLVVNEPPLVQLPTEPTEWFPLGAELTSLENGKLIVAPEGTPRELIVGTVTLNGLETK